MPSVNDGAVAVHPATLGPREDRAPVNASPLVRRVVTITDASLYRSKDDGRKRVTVGLLTSKRSSTATGATQLVKARAS